MLRSIFNIEIPKEQDIIEANQLKLAYRISTVFSVLFLVITIMYGISKNVSVYFSFLTLLISIFCAIYLNYTKNYKLIFWIFAILGNLLSASTLYFIKGGIHYSDMIWVLVCVWLAYVGLGRKYGVFFLLVNFINLVIFNLTTVNETIRLLHIQSEMDMIAVSIETGCGLLAFGYLTGEFVKMQRYREGLIEQNSKEILSLNSTINANERMVGIGELTMGLAHDLNSPLSSVKFGIQNIKDAVHQLFQQNLYRISENEFQEAVAYALQLSKRPIIGGIKYLKEEQLLNDKLASLTPKYNIPASNGLLKCGITHSDHELIEWVLTSENSQSLIQTLNDMVVIFQMIEMVSHAGQQSAEVISSLRNFTSHARKELPESTNLRESLKMVMHVLVSRFKDKISIELNVPENLTISALPRDLFQIWSNVLKNSMEALEENGGGVIKVSGQKTANEIEVVIENNGPKIDEEIREHIFDRFTSSKGSLNSGFGLHIVKQILERNGWNVNVSSEDERTAFKFTMHNISLEAAHHKD